ncbi:MAG: methyltransferase domain-containing protein [Chlamydiales bacterium]|nr:methyltransferase domain-containing protein [Chlamydiales bacterium]
MSTTLQKQLWNAEEYYKNSSIQFESSKKILNQVSFTSFEKILDIGCGDGKITTMIAMLASRGEVIGIDRSPDMISYASQKFQNCSNGKVSFLLKDAEEINYISKFDIIFSSYALHWIQNFAIFADKVYQALKSSGKIVFTIPLGISSALERSTEEITQKPEWRIYLHDFRPPWRFFTALEYDQMISQAGFKKEVFEVIMHKKIFDSRKDFENYVIQWYPYLQGILEDKRDVFFTEIIDRYLELEPPLTSGEVYFEFQRIDIIASK